MHVVLSGLITRQIWPLYESGYLSCGHSVLEKPWILLALYQSNFGSPLHRTVLSDSEHSSSFVAHTCSDSNLCCLSKQRM